MSKDRAIGVGVLVVSIAILILYFWLVFLSPPAWQMLTIQITAFIGVGAILVILAWIGYTLATTSAPEPLPELTKELEQGKKDTEAA